MMQRNWSSVLFVVVGVIALLAAATVAHASNYKVVQGRTLFPDWNGPGGAVTPQITPNIFTKTAKEYGRMGLFRPKKCIMLNLNRDTLAEQETGLGEKEIEAVVWKFSNDYYFPETSVVSHTIDVVAWAPFVAVAEVKFKGVSEPIVYADWVETPALPFHDTFLSGEQPCPE